MPNIIVALTLLAAASASQAPVTQSQAPPAPPQLQALLRCRSVTTAEARLQCYDAAAASLAQATATGAVVVIDQNAIRRARRSLFGLSLPNLPFLGGGDGDAQPSELQAKIRSARGFDYGKWLITLDDGAVWQTTEPDTRSRPPRAGDVATIRRGALGRYLISWKGSRSISVRRLS